MSDWFDALQYTFMFRALWVGVLLSILSGFLGCFVVQRRMSFLGNGLAHSAFGGVAFGLLVGLNPLWIAVPFTIAVAVFIHWTERQGRLSTDTAIGVYFSVSVALGMIFLSLRRQYSEDAFNYLFGSILSITAEDAFLAVALTLMVLATYPLWGAWIYATFDRELARADRVKTDLHDLLLSVLLAVFIVISMKILGIILVSAYLVVPAATGRILAATFIGMIGYAIVIGVGTTVLGLFLSYQLDWPTGAVIVLVQTLVFVGIQMGSRVFRILGLFLAFAMVGPMSAHAYFQVLGSYGGNAAQQTLTKSDGKDHLSDGYWGESYGIGFHYRLMPVVAIETGAYSMERVVYGGATQFQFSTLQFPVWARLDFGGPFVALGAYMGWGVGKVIVSTDSGKSDVYEYRQVNLHDREWGIGVMVGYQYRLTWLTQHVVLRIDGRYQQGINDVSLLPGVKVRYSDMAVLGGVGFELR